MPGDDQLEDRGEHLLLGERAVAVGGDDEVGDQVLAGLGALAVEQRGEVADDRVRRRHRLGRRLGPECGASRVRNHRPRSARSGSGMPSSSQITVNGSGNAKPATRSTTPSHRGSCRSSSRPSTIARTRCSSAVDPAPAERGHRQPAQPGVVGRVDGEHVPGQRRAGQALGDDLAAAGQRGVHVLGQPRVVQRRPGLLVADDQPGRVPVGERDLVHRAGRADLREQRERVVAVVGHPTSRAPDARSGASSSVQISRKPEHNRSITARRPSTSLQTAVWVHTQRGGRLGHVQAVVDQQPVGDRLARRLHDLDGVEVGEQAVEAGGDVSRPWASIGPPGSRARSRTVSVSAAASGCGRAGRRRRR